MPNKKLLIPEAGGLVPSENFETVLYTGNQTARSITGLDFTPDLVWIKSRNETNLHVLTDSVRGTNKQLFTNQADADSTSTDRLTSFDTDGFSIAAGSALYRINKNSINYVSWNWKAGGSSVLNEDGSINSQVSANAAAGFSIVSYTGNGSTGSVGHGLGVAPELIIAKNRDGTNSWVVRSSELGNGYLQLNDTAAYSSSVLWGTPSVDVFDFTHNANGLINGNKYIAYCFASVADYSKIGSYEGNQTLNVANQVDFGFAPAFVMIKNADASTTQWIMLDNKRTNGYAFYANSSGAESSYAGDILFSSQGLEFKSTNININRSSETYIYMAFAS